MEPVRIKLYGLFSVTRRGYLIQVASAGLLMAALLAMWLFRWLKFRDQTKDLDLNAVWLLSLLDLTPWVVLAIAVLQSIEAVFVLRAFARKQATQPPSPPPPAE